MSWVLPTRDRFENDRVLVEPLSAADYTDGWWATAKRRIEARINANSGNQTGMQARSGFEIAVLLS